MISNLWLRWRSRATWRVPARSVATLEAFSRTEIEGGRDIMAAIPHVRDPKLKIQLKKHAEDELRHGELFASRAAALRAQLPPGCSPPAVPEKTFDLARGRHACQLDAHGIPTLDALDEHGVIAFVAMLWVNEQRAEAMFRVHRDLLASEDPQTAALFEQILRDERYHVSYTRAFLDRWRDEGRGAEVDAVLRRAVEWRWWSAYKAYGARAGGRAGHLLLLAVYYTLALPFALVARLRRPPTGWQPGHTTTVRSQH